MSLWNKFASTSSGGRWMEDSESNSCLLCHNYWTVRLRRHHCRVCCRLVCSNCSAHFVELDSDGVSYRVCDECFPKLDIHPGLPCHTAIETSLKSEEALFKIVLHGADGLYPQSFTPSTPEDSASCAGVNASAYPPRNVYCTVSTAGKTLLLTTKVKQCEPLLSYQVTFEESFVVKADLSKSLESVLIFQLYEKNGSVIGKCRTCLGDFADVSARSPSTQPAVLFCKDLPLRGLHNSSFPTVIYSVVRKDWKPCKSGYVGFELPMYQTRIPYATEFSCLPSADRLVESVSLHMTTPTCY